uniref:Uncharacterized protein n=1 Tax=Globisporangium ultimum (strain ATCC 200006 / CBS 805.95 / DAOM BR144) TaxID=431595 RepID=K3X647_GLOUD
MPTKKTASLERFKEYVGFMIPRLGLLLTFSVEKPFRKLKLRRFISMQKKLLKMCLQLTEGAGRRTIVGFGGWSNLDISRLIKKCPSGPVKRFERKLQEFCTVVPIDEYRTNKVHADCHTSLVYQYCQQLCRDGVERCLKTYSVLYYPHNGCYGMTVSRDANASRNILQLLQHQMQGTSRPEVLCRGETTKSTNAHKCPM